MSTSSERPVGVPFKGRIHMVEAGWLRRRRRARQALVYGGLIALTLIMLGPLLYATLSSFREDALAWPPAWYPPKFWPSNWVGSWQLGRQGGGDPWFGGWAPGHVVRLEVTLRFPQAPPAPPEVLVLPPAGLDSDPRPDTEARVELLEEAPSPTGPLATYRVTLSQRGAQAHARLRVALRAAPGAELVRTTLWPSKVSPRFSGTVLTWQNLTPGLLGYVFESYRQAWTAYRGPQGAPLFPRWVLNSFVYAALKTVLILLGASLAGFALARLRFPGRRVLFYGLLFAMMVPGQVTSISNFLLLQNGIFGLSRLWGAPTLINSLPALLFFPALVDLGRVFLMKQFIESIPRELDEAARLDGAGTFQVYLRVILPLSLPALGALAILSFQGAWNELFWPLVVLRSQEKFLLPIGLMRLNEFYGSQGGANWNLILSGAVMAAIPILIVFVLFQRYFIEGIRIGSLKG